MTHDQASAEFRASIKKMARDPYVAVYVDFLADRLTENLTPEIMKAHAAAVGGLGNWQLEQAAALEAAHALAKITHGQSDGGRVMMQDTLLSIPDDVKDQLQKTHDVLATELGVAVMRFKECEPQGPDNSDFEVRFPHADVLNLMQILLEVSEFCQWLATRDVQERVPDREVVQ